MHRFYAPDIATTLLLPEGESGHAVRVLRLVEGDEIEVIDGKGTLYNCKITLAHHKHCAVEIVASQAQPCHWKPVRSLAMAPTKSIDRTEWALEKCIEMGLNEFIPIRCRFSERKDLKVDRIEKIAVAAMKQSLKASMPQLLPLTDIKQLIDTPFSGQRFIAYVDSTLPRDQRKSFAQAYAYPQNVQILIGPEGDFSAEEVDCALQHGFIPVSLGESRLRTETAAVMAVAAVHTIAQTQET